MTQRYAVLLIVEYVAINEHCQAKKTIEEKMESIVKHMCHKQWFGKSFTMVVEPQASGNRAIGSLTRAVVGNARKTIVQ